jgi:hypothetical protein
MEMLLHNKGDLQDSTVALVINVRNMWEVSTEGSHTFWKLDPFPSLHGGGGHIR